MKQDSNQADTKCLTSGETAQEFNSIEEYLQHLQKEYQALENRKSQMKSSISDRELSKLNRNLRMLKMIVKDVEKMPLLRVDSFVRDRQAYLGQVLSFQVDSNSKPLAQVRLDDRDNSLKIYSPHNLNLVEQCELRYQWDGARISKLVRQVDKKECDDLSVLDLEEAIAKQDIERAKKIGQSQDIIDFYQQKVSYCVTRRKQLKSQKTKEAEKLNQTYSQQSLNFSAGSGISKKQQKLLTKLGNNATEEKRIQTLKISKIELHEDCQQREFISPEVVEEYAERYKENQPLPAVKVIFDGVKYWLYDGFHTIEAAIKAQLSEVRCEVKQGSFRDAVLASCGVNANHGLRRSRKTKRNAVMRLLKDIEWGKWSNCEIARRCKVSESLVRSLRKNESSLRLNEVTRQDKHGNITEMSISNIGKTKENFSPRKYEVTTEESPETDKLIAEQINPEPNKPELEKASNLEFFPNQLLQIQLSDLNSASEKLKLLNHSYCRITAKTELGNGYNVKVFNGEGAMKSSFVVKAEDLTPVKQATLTLTYEPNEFLALMSLYGSPESLLTELKRSTGGQAKVFN